DRGYKAPARKRRKTRASPKKGAKQDVGQPILRPRRRGTLAALTSMPLDILYEIFTHMHPLDLLHTARTTKMLRSVLMSASLAWIWKDSYSAHAQDLPPLPDDMNVPQFVSLVYDKVCHASPYCSQPSAGKVIWDARIRCCKKCLSNTYVFCVTFPALLYTTLQSTNLDTEGRYNEEELYPVDIARDFQVEYTRDTKDDDNLQDAWLSKKEEHSYKLREHATLCEEWEEQRQLGRNAELQQIKERRKAEILRRLMDLGWGKEIEMFDAQAFAKHKLVSKTQLVTDKVWSTIQEPLLEYMENVKASRLEDEKHIALNNRYRMLVGVYHEFRFTQPHRSIFPGVGDIATINEVVHTIVDTPYDKNITRAALSAILHKIPQSYFDEWRARCDDSLIQLLGLTRDSGKQTSRADLDLATTVFTYAKKPYKEMPYPFVLLAPDTERVQSWSATDYSTYRPWSAERLAVSTSPIAAKLVALAGLDPQTATHTDMDARDPWYVCTTDESQCTMVRAMSWRCAVRSQSSLRHSVDD
ncbi:hypothetical protein BD626DRAFT_599450, partial [Schizophyllum amplum]